MSIGMALGRRGADNEPRQRWIIYIGNRLGKGPRGVADETVLHVRFALSITEIDPNEDLHHAAEARPVLQCGQMPKMNDV